MDWKFWGILTQFQTKCLVYLIKLWFSDFLSTGVFNNWQAFWCTLQNSPLSFWWKWNDRHFSQVGRTLCQIIRPANYDGRWSRCFFKRSSRYLFRWQWPLAAGSGEKISKMCVHSWNVCIVLDLFFVCFFLFWWCVYRTLIITTNEDIIKHLLSNSRKKDTSDGHTCVNLTSNHFTIYVSLNSTAASNALCTIWHVCYVSEKI